MNIEFGTSNRGRPTLIYQGYEYVKKQETNTTTHWICRHYRQIKCSILVITPGSELIKMPKDHICNFKPGATEALTEMLLLLETTKDLWLGDGTFKQCPDMFYQLYTIHVTIGGYNPPCIYALLPNKTEKTYHDFTQALLQLIPNKENIIPFLRSIAHLQ